MWLRVLQSMAKDLRGVLLNQRLRSVLTNNVDERNQSHIRVARGVLKVAW